MQTCLILIDIQEFCWQRPYFTPTTLRGYLTESFTHYCAVEQSLARASA